MSRTVKELQEEARVLGIHFDSDQSVDDMRDALARTIWQREQEANHSTGWPFPLQVEVMLARDASKLSKEEFNEMFDNDRWVAELKLNGCRGILILEDAKIPRMTSRRRSDVNHRYEDNVENVPQFKNFGWKFKGLTIIDGELVHPVNSIVTTEGTKTENQLQTSVAMLNSGSSKGIAMQLQYGNLQYWVFDILWINGVDFRGKPFYQRRIALQEFVSEQKHPDIFLTPQWGLANIGFYELYKEIVKQGNEGIMLKEVFGTYISTGRPKTMWKMKRRVTYDAFITGFVPAKKGKGFENYIGAFEVSAFIDGEEKIIGAVSSMDLETRKDATVYEDPQSRHWQDSFVTGLVPTLSPKYLMRCLEIKGQEWSKNRRLFHCQMVGWRLDKSATDCQIRGEDVKIGR